MTSASFLNRNQVKNLLDARLVLDKTVLVRIMTAVPFHKTTNNVVNSFIKDFKRDLQQRNRAVIKGI